MADTNKNKNINKQATVIQMTLATNRDDGGKTENYHIYAGGGQVQVKNKRGETIIKNAVLGGNGTIYIANELAGSHTAWVLLPRSDYDKLVGNFKEGVAKKGGRG